MTTSNVRPIDTEDADIGHGECPICGKYRDKIDAGKMKPCYMWERVKEDEDAE